MKFAAFRSVRRTPGAEKKTAIRRIICCGKVERRKRSLPPLFPVDGWVMFYID